MSRRTLLCLSGSVVIFIAAFLIYRVHFIPESSLSHLGFETTAIAESIATHGTFADPFRDPSGPSAFLAPGYPAFLALVMKVFGTGARGYFALQWFVTIFIATQLALWPWITRRMQLGYAAGFIAAVIWLASNMKRDDVWESHFVALLTVALAFAMYLVVEKSQSRATAIGCALLWGVALLFSPVTLLVLLAWAIWLFISRRVPRKQIALIITVAIVCIVPWTIRNYTVFHRVFYVRDNLGLELDLGNNDCAAFAFDINLASGCFSQLHPNDNPQHAALARRLGEIEYFHRHMLLTRWWISNHPGRFATLTGQRALAFWLPEAMQYPWRLPYRDWIITVMNLLGIAGVVRLWRKNRSSAAVFLLWMLLFPIIYYFVPYTERYRAPVLWMTFLPAGYAISSLFTFQPSSAD
jgi:4-amino-4-deoxy-L-arabinose transferase-like glycosyltransferase